MFLEFQCLLCLLLHLPSALHQMVSVAPKHVHDVYTTTVTACGNAALYDKVWTRESGVTTHETHWTPEYAVWFMSVSIFAAPYPHAYKMGSCFYLGRNRADGYTWLCRFYPGTLLRGSVPRLGSTLHAMASACISGAGGSLSRVPARPDRNRGHPLDR